MKSGSPFHGTRERHLYMTPGIDLLVHWREQVTRVVLVVRLNRVVRFAAVVEVQSSRVCGASRAKLSCALLLLLLLLDVVLVYCLRCGELGWRPLHLFLRKHEYTAIRTRGSQLTILSWYETGKFGLSGAVE